MYPPSGDLHHDQHVQPPQHDGVDVEEVGRQQPGRLRFQEGPPAGVGLAGRRADPGGGEDPADGAGADPMAEPDQFALHAPVSPAGILAGEPEDKVAYLVADGWPSGPVGVGPVPADQAAVPGQQRGRGDDPMPPQLGRQGTNQRRQHGPVRPRQARPTNLTTQHGDFVAQHQQLGDHRRVAAGGPR